MRSTLAFTLLLCSACDRKTEPAQEATPKPEPELTSRNEPESDPGLPAAKQVILPVEPSPAPLAILRFESLSATHEDLEGIRHSGVKLEYTMIVEIRERLPPEASLWLDAVCEVAGRSLLSNTLVSPDDDPFAGRRATDLVRIHGHVFGHHQLPAAPDRCELSFFLDAKREKLLLGTHAWLPGHAPTLGRFEDPLEAQPEAPVQSRPRRDVSAPTAIEAATPSCTQASERLQTRLANICERDAGPSNHPGPPAPEGVEMPWHRYPGLTIEVKADSYVMDGQPHDDLDTLLRRQFFAFDRVESMIARKGYRKPVIRWLLAADPELPAKRVIELANALEARGLVDGGIVFRGPDLPPLEPHDRDYYDEVGRLLDAAPPRERSVVAAKEAQRLIGGCLPVAEAFAEMALAEPDDRCDVLARAIPRGLAKCDCAIDPPRLESFLSRVNGPIHFKNVPVYVQLSLAGEWITYSDDETWAQVIGKFDWGSVDNPVVPHAISFQPELPRLDAAQLEALRKSCMKRANPRTCEQLCGHGDPEGCSAWARALVTEGRGPHAEVARRHARARQLRQRAALLGEATCRTQQTADACVHAASLYNSLMDEPNRKKRREILGLACGHGDDDACRIAGGEFERLGSPERAREMFALACARGHEPACESQARVEDKMKAIAQQASE
jgi:hypothetical protein